MGNLYGYTDYDGPDLSHARRQNSAVLPMTSSGFQHMNDTSTMTSQQQTDRYFAEEDDDENDPLRAGLWMEGDSLAPPCGSAISLVHAVLEFANVTRDDVVYDLGAGDGRVCLEALVRKRCRHCVGVELEEDLVEKGNRLIADLPDEYKLVDSQIDGLRNHGDSADADAVADSDGRGQACTIPDEACAGSTEPTLPSSSIGVPRIQLIQADLRHVLKALVAKAAKERNDDAKLEELASTAHGDDGGEGRAEDTAATLALEGHSDLPLPTVIVLYLLPDAIVEIQDELLYLLKRDCRIVCNTWGFPSSFVVKPIDTTEVHERNGASTSLFLYTPECYDRLAGFEFMLKMYNS